MLTINTKIPPEIRHSWEVPEFRIEFWEGRKHSNCIIIPVINEGDRIRRLVERMADNDISNIADIIIIDGGSTDGSLETNFLQHYGVRGVIVKTGPGKLSAQLRCAYAFALDQGYQGIVTIDGNDKDDPEAIPRFIEALTDGIDFVQASRFIAGGVAENTPKSRDLAIRLIHAPALSLSSGFHWTDTTQGFRAYSRRLLTDPAINPFRNIFQEYELLAYLSHRAPILGYQCKEIATSRKYPEGEVPTKISAVRGNFKVLKTLALACTGHYNTKIVTPVRCSSRQPLYALAATGFLVCLLAFFPGWMSPDSVAQYSEAKEGLYRDWNPVLMAWWWRQLDHIYSGPALFLIQNLLLYWAAWLLFAKAAGQRVRGYSFLILFCALWPGLLFPLGQIWKDIVFGCTLFFVWGFLFYAHSQRRRLRAWEFAIVFLFSTFAIGVKPNGLAALPFVFFSGFQVGSSKPIRLKASLLAAILLTFLAWIACALVVPQSKIIKTSPFQYTQTYDLLAISAGTQQDLLPPYINRKLASTGGSPRSLYSPGGNDLLFYKTVGNISTGDPMELSELNKLWVRSIVEHPWEYLRHRVTNFKELLRWGADTPAVVAFPGIVENRFGLHFDSNEFSTLIAETMTLSPWIFFPWIYFAALAFALTIMGYLHKLDIIISSMAASIIAFTIPHIFIAPAADFRYLYYAYLLIAAIFALAIMLSIEKLLDAKK